MFLVYIINAQKYIFFNMAGKGEFFLKKRRKGEKEKRRNEIP